MKTIGILTFHYANNYGAVLQTFALRKIINSFPECNAEIINYVSKGYAYSLDEKTDTVRQLLIRKRDLFEKFVEEQCGLNSPMISEVVGNRYNYYCVGSDQVWNLRTRATHIEYLFPHLDKNAIRISYAASIGMSVKKAYYYKDLFQKYVSEFKAISVREQEHVDFMRTTCQKECKCVLDPTLLLDAEDYVPIMSKELRDYPFILFFWLNHDSDLMKGVEFVNNLSRKYQLPIVHTVMNARPYMFNKDDGCMFYEGVENFLWYVKHASFVVTNSYHATLFSMQFKTPFYVFTVESMQSRIHSLIEKFAIGNRVVNNYMNVSELNASIDFRDIKDKIKAERKHSIDFLKEALDIMGEDGD